MYFSINQFVFQIQLDICKSFCLHNSNLELIKVNRPRNKIVEPQILPKNERTNLFFYPAQQSGQKNRIHFFGRICGSTILFPYLLTFSKCKSKNKYFRTGYIYIQGYPGFYPIFIRREVYQSNVQIHTIQCIDYSILIFIQGKAI